MRRGKEDMQKTTFAKGVFQISVAVAAVLFSLPIAVSAAKQTGYVASILSISAPKRLVAGETTQVLVTVQNIGSSVWKRDGKNYVSLYRFDPQRRRETKSAFASTSWRNPEQPVGLSVAQVKPGASVVFAFPIKAPVAPGSYREDFMVTAENAAWMPNGKFSLDILVGEAAAPQAAYGVANSAWSAELVDRGGMEWQIDAGEHVMVAMTFKNTGTKAWTQDGTSFLSLYAATEKKERVSSFKDMSWTGSRAGRLKEKSVAPGGIGHVLLELRAPDKPGAYQETFQLAAEDTAWIGGGTVTLPIRVPMPSEFIATAPPTDSDSAYLPPSIPSSQHTTYRSLLLLRSAQDIALAGNERQTVTLGFKNTGESLWASRGIRAKEVRFASTDASTGSFAVVRDESWIGAAEPVFIQGQTKPGEIGFVSFRIKAPAKAGKYTASFVLYADGQPVQGGDVDIPVTVTSDGSVPDLVALSPSSSVPVIPISGDATTLPAEPMIRVGLYKTTDDRMMVRAKAIPIHVRQGETALCRLGVGQTASVIYLREEKLYRLSGDACVGQSTEPFLFRSEDQLSPMEIADFSRPVAWLPGANDNTFRNQLELRFVPETGNVWVINELPFESYLHGIAETSNSSPGEYQRALLTAARTYAYYHIQRNTKHGGVFHVDASFDQVYRGYGAEARNPNVVAAVAATRGQIVTYNGTLAITPYYSRSDGRTRAWGEVWYGGSRYPWLVSVPVPWDNGKTLWGHGVGMSASGALGMANDGKISEEILRYFYQGTELRRAYR